MSKIPLGKSLLLACFIIIACVTCWELYLRKKGFETSFNDDPALWTHKRNMVYGPKEKTTVFIGSSRIKFDLDISTWEQITGNKAVQLACVGSTPIPVLENLANDEKFTGNLIIDVTEGLFFSLSPRNATRPSENLKYYKEKTPAQQASFYINWLLESQFVFLDKEWLSMNAMLGQLNIPDRKGVRNFKGFPADFGRVKFNRQEYMTPKFAADTNLQNQVIGIWEGFAKMSKDPPISGAILDSLLHVVKSHTDKIKQRGGDIIFIRTPSSGGFSIGENLAFPRNMYWDKLLSVTQCYGIHYADFDRLKNFKCPENSHLSMADAVLFTKAFIEILRKEKGWKL